MVTYERLSRLTRLYDDYKDIAEFRRAQTRFNYVQFDYAVTHGLTLFTIEPDFDFEALTRRTDDILNAIPSIKRIFAQPFIHLKEHDTIMPVEAVRIVGNNTLTHIASHSELWTDVKNSEIKPVKLLSRTYEDNYGIYENLVFCNVVDDILAYVSDNIRFLKELIYTNRTIEINLLERVNHLNYFLALGKLHIAYSRSFESYYAVAERCLNKLQYISNSIVPRLKRPVYKNNRTRPANLKLHKTNILSMHKEYHRIYKLAKSFAAHGVEPVRELSTKDIADLDESYCFFCRALTVFAVGHFNFACDEEKTFDLSRLKLDFTFKNISLELKQTTHGKTHLLAVTVTGDKPYRTIIIPSLAQDNKPLVKAVKSAVSADEYIVFSPFEERENGEVLIDIGSIESFRRIQQIVLRAMIYADAARVECPFCRNKLTLNAEKSTTDDPVYECLSCRTEIHSDVCPDTGKPYFYTEISEFTPQTDDENSWLAKRRAEGIMYFRNITELDGDAKPVCPHCGKVHV